VVEPWKEGQVFDGDMKGHVGRLINGWCDPIPRLFEATDFSRNAFRWEIYNRAPLSSWSRGRVSFVGDAVHPVSPYAAYGMGMAIEDGFWLARSLGGVDLANASQLAQGLARYDTQRVWYTNKQAVMARRLGHMFHRLPWPLSTLRDAVFNHTGFLERRLVQDYLKDAEDQMLALDFETCMVPGSAS
jgi:2-polyprenyl-6-methoxyphenol hydroxylase-like FAD-dependent oxidoreductase